MDSSANLSGWVIDLRNHGGGKIACESLGLSPLFDNNLIGFAFEGQDNFAEIICTNNYLKFGNHVQESLSYDSTLINKNKKIAVLIGENTVSSGEFLALAFKFQNKTKTFGKLTRGKTSHCGRYNLKDGAILFMAQSYFYDFNRNKIKKGVTPEEECDSEKSLPKAVDWIK